jgi:hypothetical protein
MLYEPFFELDIGPCGVDFIGGGIVIFIHFCDEGVSVLLEVCFDETMGEKPFALEEDCVREG